MCGMGPGAGSVDAAEGSGAGGSGTAPILASIAGRAALWRHKARKLLRQDGPVSIKPFEQHVAAGRRIPVTLPEEGSMSSVINDGGRSWCVCGGLSHGFMIGCDFCDQWYHGECVGVTPENAPQPDISGIGRHALTEHDQGKYRCPKCCTGGRPYHFQREMENSQTMKQEREQAEPGLMAKCWEPVNVPPATRAAGAPIREDPADGGNAE